MDEPETKNPLSHRERDRERGSHELLLRARDMRRAAGEAERTLGKYRRGRRLNGYKFRRQMIIDSYIVDFACLEAKLIAEADGGQHVDQAAYDQRRTVYLERMGYTVLRFWNHEVERDLDGVVRVIQAALDEVNG